MVGPLMRINVHKGPTEKFNFQRFSWNVAAAAATLRSRSDVLRRSSRMMESERQQQRSSITNKMADSPYNELHLQAFVENEQYTTSTKVMWRKGVLGAS